MSTSKLFQPIRVGTVQLQNRVVMAPLTRMRGLTKTDGVHGPTAKEYYTQRGSVPGTLIITEATFIAQKAGGYTYVPGIWNDEQVAKWKEISDGVHSKGSFIFMQLWQLGRVADPQVLVDMDPTFKLVGPSDIPAPDKSVPHALTLEEIAEYMEFFSVASSNAIKAGMDGVECHFANGYLADQFAHSVSNNRTDAYGGSVEKRSRFMLEALEACVKAIGQEKTAVRLSPWGTVQGMTLPDAEVIEQFTYIVTQIKERYPNLAYIHLVEPRVDGVTTRDSYPENHTNDYFRKIWAPRPLISAGGYKREVAIEVADKWENELIAFGRDFICNPDLPLRLKEDLPLAAQDRSLYYLPGEHTGKGYTDWPTYEEEKNKSKASL